MDWFVNSWYFLFALSSAAWSAVAAWVAVAIGFVTVVITGRYAKQQIRQARQQIDDAETARAEQAEAAEEARADRERARLEQATQAEAMRRQQADDAQKLREEQAQPNVVMFAEPVPGNWQFLDIVIKNFGQTPALISPSI